MGRMKISVTFGGSYAVVRRPRSALGLARLLRPHVGCPLVVVDVDGVEVHRGVVPPWTAETWAGVIGGALELAAVDAAVED